MSSIEPARYTFTIYGGATFSKRIAFQIDGVTEDLTGYSAELVIKNKPSGTTLMAISSPEDGITLGDAEGTIDLLIEKTVTEAITWKTAVYELFLTDPSDHTDVILKGHFKVILF